MSLLIALLALGQPASQPASQPNLPTGGTGRDVTATVTMILEPDENHVKVQESWSFSNTGGRIVDAAALSFPLPAGSRRISMDEEAPGFAGAEDGSRFYATQPLGAAPAAAALAYLWQTGGGSAELHRAIPVNVNGMRVIVEDIAGLEVTSNLRFTRRVRELNGLNFLILDFDPLTAGATWDLTVTGLPNHTTLPRTMAMVMVAGLVAWFLVQLASQRRSTAEVNLGAMAAPARRDRIVKALELLERDRAEDKVTDTRYARRHTELMKELADVLREIELAKPGHGRG